MGSGNVGATNVMRSAGQRRGRRGVRARRRQGRARGGARATRWLRRSRWPAARGGPGRARPHVPGLARASAAARASRRALGAFLPLEPLAALVALPVFALVAALTRYVRLARLGAGRAEPRRARARLPRRRRGGVRAAATARPDRLAAIGPTCGACSTAPSDGSARGARHAREDRCCSAAEPGARRSPPTSVRAGHRRPALDPRRRELASADRRAPARTRRYLPGVELPAGLRATASLAEAAADAEAVLVAVPSEFCRSRLSAARVRRLACRAARLGHEGARDRDALAA